MDRAALYWEVALTAFTGHRLLVGVAPLGSVRHGHLEVAAAYLFDCHGRRVGGKEKRPQAVYGRKMGSGDRVGVLYHPGEQTLTFFDGGLSMGVAFRGVVPPQRGSGPGGLFPIIHLPGLPGEAVAVVPLGDLRVGGGRGGGRLIDAPRGAAALAATAARWAPAPHPRDGHLCVATSAEAVTYWLPVADPARMTVGAVKTRLAALTGHTVGQGEFIAGGVLLLRDEETLDAVGVRFVRGQCATDLLLYFPHLVS